MISFLKTILLSLVLIQVSACDEVRNMDDPALSNPEPRTTSDTAMTDSTSTLNDSI